jgi:hypothetical protein
MMESAKSKSDIALEASIPNGAAPLESILRTEELHRRPWRPPDYEKENRALVRAACELQGSAQPKPRALTTLRVQVSPGHAP